MDSSYSDSRPMFVQSQYGGWSQTQMIDSMNNEQVDLHSQSEAQSQSQPPQQLQPSLKRPRLVDDTLFNQASPFPPNSNNPWMCEPPRDVEAYIHRSGRTGRAGNTGVAIMLYDSRKSSVSRIEKEAGIKFEHISTPQPDDIARAVGMEAAEKITQVCDSVVPAFLAAAKELLETSGLSAEQLLAKALAETAGFTEIKKWLLLTSMENHVTLLLQAGKPIYTHHISLRCLSTFW